MSLTTLRSDYSSEVCLTLLAQGQCIPLAKTGPGYVVFRAGVDLPACDAEIEMMIDERRHVYPVRLVNGAVPFERRAATEFRQLDGATLRGA